MTENRFKWVYIKDNELEFQDNGIVKRFNNYRLEEFLNELNDENTHIKNTIKEMYNNERTELGRSVLKQLLDSLE
jgi:DNA anti-recombination protein RmuC